MLMKSRPQRIIAALLGVTMVVALGACGGDDGEEATDDAADASATTVAEETTSSTIDEAEAAAEVEANVATFFDGMSRVADTPEAEVDALVDQTIALLEDGGDEEKEQLKQFGPLAKGLTAEILEVTIVDATTAEFTFDLLINGNPTQVTDATGKAVLNDEGVWVLSQETWGALAALADTGGGDGGGDDGGGDTGGG